MVAIERLRRLRSEVLEGLEGLEGLDGLGGLEGLEGLEGLYRAHTQSFARRAIHRQGRTRGESGDSVSASVSFGICAPCAFIKYRAAAAGRARVRACARAMPD